MLKIILSRPNVQKRHVILASVLVSISIATAGSVFAMNFYTNQQIANQVAKTNAELKKMDEQIAEITAKKIAEQKAKEEAERKAKEKAALEEKRKAEAEAALRAQLAGKVVTPKACAIKGAHGNANNIDVVINKKHCFSPINFVPSDLISVYGGYLISAKIRNDLVKMFNAAAAAGKPLGLTSSYRSYDNQVTTYNNWVAVNGSVAAADRVSARPGYSEHQTGFAVDLRSGGSQLEAFAGTPAYAWLKKYGYKYGFIQRYQPGYEAITGYAAEAWHWRYVGVSVATDMKNKGIKTLEQYWNIEGGSY